MASMIEVLLILDDIDKDRIIKLKSGKRAYRTTYYLDDKVDKYGNSVSAWAKQEKEEKDNKAHRKYLGNGTCFWSDGVVTVVNKDNPQGHIVAPPHVVSTEPAPFTEEAEDLPF
tara:strand:+ start:7910 stop:8251 length:342 start_codon:yes stop_codon:yes gene_type:complete